METPLPGSTEYMRCEPESENAIALVAPISRFTESSAASDGVRFRHRI
ncbi:MAG: hypothetical protein JOZ78_08495 [Chroococcidiopsidaceae cyanobacterium CP_BM_ER_R8_30]|nr:hypothetical protein [Chroococcidiopsidaceae cyanobacterium CP_BM_ER_R8_30]